MTLTKNKWYRITEIDGKRHKMQFISKSVMRGVVMYSFEEWGKMLIISKGCIVKIESYETITPAKQAKNMGKYDEYLKYMRVDGKIIRTNYIYKTIFETTKKGA